MDTPFAAEPTNLTGERSLWQGEELSAISYQQSAFSNNIRQETRHIYPLAG
jgi:hypothetical protein